MVAEIAPGPAMSGIANGNTARWRRSSTGKGISPLSGERLGRRRLFALLALLEHHLEGDPEQEQPARDAEGGQRDAEKGEHHRAGEGEGDEDDRGDDRAADRDRAPHLGRGAAGDGEEERSEADRVDRDQQRREGIEQVVDHCGPRFLAAGAAVLPISAVRARPSPWRRNCCDLARALHRGWTCCRVSPADRPPAGRRTALPEADLKTSTDADRFPVTIDTVDALPLSAFLAAFGDVAEHSPWVAEDAAAARPFRSREAMIAAFEAAVAAAPRERQLALVRAHPDLAGKAAMAGAVAEDSKREQKGAGLDRLSPDDFARFTGLNDRYRARFGFPFIFAVKGATAAQILDAFEARIEHDVDTEFSTALAQIARIFRFRIEDRVSP